MERDTDQLRRSDVRRDTMLVEKDRQIERLTTRVETLTNYDRLAAQQKDQGDRLRDIQHFLFGVTGDNGLNSRVKALDGGINDMRGELRGMREEEFAEVKAALVEQREESQAQARDQRERFQRWALGLASLLVMLLGASSGLLVALGH